MFPDGTAGETFGTAETQDQLMATLSAGQAPDATQMPAAPAGMAGHTGASTGAEFGQLTSLAGPGPRNSEQDEGRRALLAAAQSSAPAASQPPLPKKVTVTCPACGTENEYKHKNQACAECGQNLDNESPFVGNQFSQLTPIAPTSVSQQPTMALNLGDGEQEREAEQDALILHLSAEQLQTLDLGPKTGQRQQWAKEGKALSDGSWPIPNVAYLKKAIQAFPGRAQGNVGKIKSWILKRAKELNYTGADLDRVRGQDPINASQPPTMWERATGRQMPNDAAHVMELQALSLDHTQGDKGLIWKVLCKTGTLALSPGPGQVDTEKPLNLTADMFLAVKNAYDDRAFEHVTIPESHGNGTLENTGTVDALEVLTKDQALADMRLSQSTKQSFARDPSDTLYMLGGMRFTDPKVREKAQNGSILNCSVGLKFNYRRKRDGKLYPVALEHTALTNQPWVDGLGAFGGADLSAPVFDQDQLPVWDGVFTPTVPPKDGGTPSQSSLSTSQTTGGIVPTMSDIATPTLEEILASQQATIERLEREAKERDRQLQLAQSTQTDQGRELHLARTDARVTELQRMGVPPGVLTRYKTLRNAAYEAQEGGTLQLSVSDGDSTQTVELGPIEQAEYLLAAIPLDHDGSNVVAITTAIGADALSLSQEPGERKEASAADKADAIEQRLHPDRFDGEGKRLPRDKRRAS